jgi:hypothetical protein
MPRTTSDFHFQGEDSIPKLWFHSALASFIEYFPNKPRQIGENHTRISKTDQYLNRKT